MPHGRTRYFCGHTDAPLTDEEREFAVALDRWKREHHQPFPTCSDVLALLKSLGWTKPPRGEGEVSA